MYSASQKIKTDFCGNGIVRIMTVEERLLRKALDHLEKHRGMRRNETDDIFERKALIVSEQDILMRNYPRKHPKLAFNPGALLQGEVLHVFPRLIFDYYTYTSSIGRFSINVESLINGGLSLPVETDIVMWPKLLWEFRGCEDPRVFKQDGKMLMLYTGYGYFLEKDTLNTSIVQAFAEFDNGFSITSRKYFKIKSMNEDYFFPKSNKDSAFLKVNGEEAVILTRPLIGSVEVGWRADANLNEAVMYEKTMEPSLPFENWEFKVGWSTNAIRLSSNEFLVGWHGIVKEDYSYRNGLAILDNDGRLLAVSNYLLAPKGVSEEYGDRPHVIFGNGLVSYKESLIWVGGVSDYAIGFFVTELERALGKLKWVSG
jgi:predicted GH43/DUF377 family glycosyl hydrolase